MLYFRIQNMETHDLCNRHNADNKIQCKRRRAFHCCAHTATREVRTGYCPTPGYHVHMTQHWSTGYCIHRALGAGGRTKKCSLLWVCIDVVVGIMYTWPSTEAQVTVSHRALGAGGSTNKHYPELGMYRYTLPGCLARTSRPSRYRNARRGHKRALPATGKPGPLQKCPLQNYPLESYVLI